MGGNTLCGSVGLFWLKNSFVALVKLERAALGQVPSLQLDDQLGFWHFISGVLACTLLVGFVAGWRFRAWWALWRVLSSMVSFAFGNYRTYSLGPTQHRTLHPHYATEEEICCFQPNSNGAQAFGV